MFLNHYMRNLQTVQRWNILPTIRTQHVAEHSYYVALYCAEMLERFVPHYTAAEKYQILLAALKHDAAEARMGDINGPTKRIIRDEERYRRLEKSVESDLGFANWDASEFGERLIKAADCLDDYFFLTTETFLGNRMVETLLEKVRVRLSRALFNAWGDRLIVGQIMNDVDEQLEQMLHFEALQNDADVTTTLDLDPSEEIPF